MAVVNLAALKAQVRFRPEGVKQENDFAFICPHGDSGSGKSTLWGMFGFRKPGTALFIQGEKGDRDLRNPDIGILDINTMYNIGSLDHLRMDEEGNINGEINNMDELAAGWEMVLAITEDLHRTGGKNVNPAGTSLRHVVWDSGTTFATMLMAWVMKTTPGRNRVIGAGGRPKTSLEDYGDVTFHFENWMIELRDLKRRMNVCVPFLSQEYTYQELAPDGVTTVTVAKKMPMVVGKKLPAKIISFADFAPYHQMVQENIPVWNPASNRMEFQSMLTRGLRWELTPKIYAKGRGDLPPAHPLRTPYTLRDPNSPPSEENQPMGWDCHAYNLKKICELGNIPM